MGTPTASVTAHGGMADRFREIREEIEDARGYEPKNTEVLGVLMQEFDADEWRR